MEENGSMRKSERPKDYNNVGASTKKSILKEKKAQVHSWWESSTSQEDFLVHDQFPWPPRSYTCTFCKREFRSAQALGGHMNIHRREKARLRQVITPPKYLPFLPTTHLDQNPNRNPEHLTKFTCSSSLAFSAPRFCKLCPLDTTNFTGVRLQKSDLTVDEFSHGKESSMIVKKSDGFLVDSKFDDLDLELRLGYS